MYKSGQLENNGSNQDVSQCGSSDVFTGPNVNSAPCALSSPTSETPAKLSTTSVLRRWRRPEAQDSSSKNVPGKDPSSQPTKCVKFPDQSSNQDKPMNPAGSYIGNVVENSVQSDYALYGSQLNPLVPQNNSYKYVPHASCVVEGGNYNRTSPLAPQNKVQEQKPPEPCPKYPTVQNSYCHPDGSNQEIHFRSPTYPIQNTPPLAHTANQKYVAPHPENTSYPFTHQKVPHEYGYNNYISKSPHDYRAKREYSMVPHNYSSSKVNSNIDPKLNPHVVEDPNYCALKSVSYAQDSRISPHGVGHGYTMPNSADRRVSPQDPKSVVYRNFPVQNSAPSMVDSRYNNVPPQNYMQPKGPGEYLPQNSSYYVDKSACLAQESRLPKPNYAPDKPTVDPRYMQGYNQTYMSSNSVMMNPQEAKHSRDYKTASAALPKKASPPFPILEQRLNQSDTNYCSDYSNENYPYHKYVMYPRTSPNLKISRDGPAPTHSYAPHNVSHSPQKLPHQEVMLPPSYGVHKYYPQSQNPEWKISKEYEHNLYLAQMNQMHARLSQNPYNRPPEVPRDLSYDQNSRGYQKGRIFYHDSSHGEQHMQYPAKTMGPVAQKPPKIVNFNIPDNTPNEFQAPRNNTTSVVKQTEYSRSAKVSGEYNPVTPPARMPDVNYDPKVPREYFVPQQAYRPEVPTSEQQGYACSPPMTANSRNPPQYSVHYPSNMKISEVPARNISPRRTFQENMPVIVIPAQHIGLPKVSPPQYPINVQDYLNPPIHPNMIHREHIYPGSIKTTGQCSVDQPNKFSNVPHARNLSQQRYHYSYPEAQYYQNKHPDSCEKNYYQENIRPHYNPNVPEHDSQPSVRNFESDFGNSEVKVYREYEESRNDASVVRTVYGKKDSDVSKSLKEFLESWEDDEDIVANLPDLVLCNNISVDKSKHVSFSEPASEETSETSNEKSSSDEEVPKESEAVFNTDEPLYILDSTNISSDALPQYLHLQQIDRLPDNIKGYYKYHVSNSNEESAEKNCEADGSLETAAATESSPKDYSLSNKVPEEKFEEGQVLNLSTNRNKECEEVNSGTADHSVEESPVVYQQKNEKEVIQEPDSNYPDVEKQSVEKQCISEDAQVMLDDLKCLYKRGEKEECIKRNEDESYVSSSETKPVYVEEHCLESHRNEEENNKGLCPKDKYRHIKNDENISSPDSQFHTAFTRDAKLDNFDFESTNTSYESAVTASVIVPNTYFEPSEEKSKAVSNALCTDSTTLVEDAVSPESNTVIEQDYSPDAYDVSEPENVSVTSDNADQTDMENATNALNNNQSDVENMSVASNNIDDINLEGPSNTENKNADSEKGIPSPESTEQNNVEVTPSFIISSNETSPTSPEDQKDMCSEIREENVEGFPEAKDVDSESSRIENETNENSQDETEHRKIETEGKLMTGSKQEHENNSEEENSLTHISVEVSNSKEDELFAKESWIPEKCNEITVENSTTVLRIATDAIRMENEMHETSTNADSEEMYDIKSADSENNALSEEVDSSDSHGVSVICTNNSVNNCNETLITDDTVVTESSSEISYQTDFEKEKLCKTDEDESTDDTASNSSEEVQKIEIFVEEVTINDNEDDVTLIPNSDDYFNKNDLEADDISSGDNTMIMKTDPFEMQEITEEDEIPVDDTISNESADNFKILQKADVVETPDDDDVMSTQSNGLDDFEMEKEIQETEVSQIDVLSAKSEDMNQFETQRETDASEISHDDPLSIQSCTTNHSDSSDDRDDFKVEKETESSDVLLDGNTSSTKSGFIEVKETEPDENSKDDVLSIKSDHANHLRTVNETEKAEFPHFDVQKEVELSKVSDDDTLKPDDVSSSEALRNIEMPDEVNKELVESEVQTGFHTALTREDFNNGTFTTEIVTDFCDKKSDDESSFLNAYNHDSKTEVGSISISEISLNSFGSTEKNEETYHGFAQEDLLQSLQSDEDLEALRNLADRPEDSQTVHNLQSSLEENLNDDKLPDVKIKEAHEKLCDDIEIGTSENDVDIVDSEDITCKIKIPEDDITRILESTPALFCEESPQTLSEFPDLLGEGQILTPESAEEVQVSTPTENIEEIHLPATSESAEESQMSVLADTDEISVSALEDTEEIAVSTLEITEDIQTLTTTATEDEIQVSTSQILKESQVSPSENLEEIEVLIPENTEEIEVTVPQNAEEIEVSIPRIAEEIEIPILQNAEEIEVPTTQNSEEIEIPTSAENVEDILVSTLENVEESQISIPADVEEIQISATGNEVISDNSDCVVIYGDDENEYVIIESESLPVENQDIEIVGESAVVVEQEMELNKQEKKDQEEDVIGSDVIICQTGIEDWVQKEEIVIENKEHKVKKMKTKKKLAQDKKKLLLSKARKKLQKLSKMDEPKVNELEKVKDDELKIISEKNVVETTESVEEKELFINPENPSTSKCGNTSDYSLDQNNSRKRAISYNDYTDFRIEFQAPKRRYSVLDQVRNVKKPLINLDEISRNITEVLEKFCKKENPTPVTVKSANSTQRSDDTRQGSTDIPNKQLEKKGDELLRLLSEEPEFYVRTEPQIVENVIAMEVTEPGKFMDEHVFFNNEKNETAAPVVTDVVNAVQNSVTCFPKKEDGRTNFSELVSQAKSTEVTVVKENTDRETCEQQIHCDSQPSSSCSVTSASFKIDKLAKKKSDSNSSTENSCVKLPPKSSNVVLSSLQPSVSSADSNLNAVNKNISLASNPDIKKTGSCGNGNIIPATKKKIVVDLNRKMVVRLSKSSKSINTSQFSKASASGTELESKAGCESISSTSLLPKGKTVDSSLFPKDDVRSSEPSSKSAVSTAEMESGTISSSSNKNLVPLVSKKKVLDPRIDRPKDLLEKVEEKPRCSDKLSNTFKLTEYTKNYIKIKTGQTIETKKVCVPNGAFRVGPKKNTSEFPSSSHLKDTMKKKFQDALANNKTRDKTGHEKKVKINLQDYRNRRQSQTELKEKVASDDVNVSDTPQKYHDDDRTGKSADFRQTTEHLDEHSTTRDIDTSNKHERVASRSCLGRSDSVSRQKVDESVDKCALSSDVRKKPQEGNRKTLVHSLPESSDASRQMSGKLKEHLASGSASNVSEKCDGRRKVFVESLPEKCGHTSRPVGGNLKYSGDVALPYVRKKHHGDHKKSFLENLPERKMGGSIEEYSTSGDVSHPGMEKKHDDGHRKVIVLEKSGDALRDPSGNVEECPTFGNGPLPDKKMKHLDDRRRASRQFQGPSEQCLFPDMMKNHYSGSRKLRLSSGDASTQTPEEYFLENTSSVKNQQDLTISRVERRSEEPKNRKDSTKDYTTSNFLTTNTTKICCITNETLKNYVMMKDDSKLNKPKKRRRRFRNLHAADEDDEVPVKQVKLESPDVPRLPRSSLGLSEDGAEQSSSNFLACPKLKGEVQNKFVSSNSGSVPTESALRDSVKGSVTDSLVECVKGSEMESKVDSLTCPVKGVRSAQEGGSVEESVVTGAKTGHKCYLDVNSNAAAEKSCNFKCHIKLSVLEKSVRNYEINTKGGTDSKLKLTLKPVKKTKPAFSEVMSSLDSLVETPEVTKKSRRRGDSDSKNDDTYHVNEKSEWAIKDKVPKVIIKRSGSGYCAVFRDVSSNPIWQPKIRLRRQKFIESLVMKNQLKISKTVPS